MLHYSEKELVTDISALTFLIKQEESERGQRFNAIYGIPRGGRIPAAMLSMALCLPVLNVLYEDVKYPNVIIIDDICDSGKTRAKYPDNFFVSLVTKEHANPTPDITATTVTGDEWIHFFWEGEPSTAGEDIVTRMIQFVGEDPNRAGVLETPKRVVKAWGEMFAGYKQKPVEILKAGFQESNNGDLDGIIYLRDIEFFSQCEHHLLPFYGKAHVGYIPKDGRVVGISKLARLVDCFARRMQIQERICNQVVDALVEFGVLGAICIIEAKHLCIACRGVGKQHSIMGCSAIRGVFKTKPEARAEAMSLLLGGK